MADDQLAELLRGYEETFEGAIVAQESQGDAFNAAILAVARYSAEKQRTEDRNAMEILEQHSGCLESREWGKQVATWLYPGDSLCIVNEADAPLWVDK